MTRPLWSFEDLVAAAEGVADGAPRSGISGFSIDTRSLAAGDVFVALKDQRDGHDFVSTAFRNGAAAALVSAGYARQAGDGALIRVDDPLRALERIGRAARRRLVPEARVIAVTGSAGKTTTKEMLRLACSVLGPTHASDKSFNNHWGVPLTLARMPSETRYAIFEIGMNHAGEITPLTAMVSPHVAIVTTVAAAHIENFPNEEAIADAKAEIFTGLVTGGAAVINLDNPHGSRLAAAARACGAHIVGVMKTHVAAQAILAGDADEAVVLNSVRSTANTSEITAARGGTRGEVSFMIGAVGDHMAMNAGLVLAALDTAGANTEMALGALAAFGPPAGRGSRTLLEGPSGPILLIDESYNANPVSMRAALSVLPGVPRDAFPRRIAVLGDMRELGAEADQMHAGLAGAVVDAGVDLVFAAGEHMSHLFHALPADKRGAWAPSSRELEVPLLSVLRGGDAVVVKGSNGSRMAILVDAMKAKFRGSH